MKIIEPACFVVSRYTVGSKPATPATPVFSIYGEHDTTFIARLIDGLGAPAVGNKYSAVLRRTCDTPLSMMQLVGNTIQALGEECKVSYEEDEGVTYLVHRFVSAGNTEVTLSLSDNPDLAMTVFVQHL